MQDNNDSPRDTIPCPELDAAMRELDELNAVEAAEADLSILRDAWARRSGKAPGFFGARLIAFALGLGCLLSTGAALADEPAKVKKPTLCTSGTMVTGEKFSGFLCTDGKRPKLFTRFVKVTFIDADGNPASYVLGWSTVQPKQAKPAPVATLKL